MQVETLSEVCTDFGENSYLEVARKRNTWDGKSNDFIIITRGYYHVTSGRKFWTKFMTFPDDPDLRKVIADAILKV